MTEASPPQSGDHQELLLRAYVESGASKAAHSKKRKAPTDTAGTDPGPSDWTVVFDTETKVDAAQRLRVGSFLVHDGERVTSRGLFYEQRNLTKREMSVLESFARKRDLTLMPVAEFVERIFFGIGYHCRATIVGFNLPFDISRLAIKHGSARGRWRGGFTFQLSPDKYVPRVQVRHLSSRMSLIRFTAKRREGRSDRKRKRRRARRDGYFVDVKTLGAALMGKPDSLDSLSKALGVATPKLSVEEHGKPLTPEYLTYAMTDVQATWECYVELKARYGALKLTRTRVHRIFSEASIGKAHFREMGIQPWQTVQPNFPKQLLGVIMSTYFGGRSEVHLRRMIVPVILCDFLSMYPTVCTLMKLWRFVIGRGMRWRDTTAETTQLLNAVTCADLQASSAWERLTTLVRVRPEGHVFPCRTKYNSEPQATIGSNRLTNLKGQWFTLADCIASKLLTGKSSIVLEAVTFEPGPPQAGLRSVRAGGADGRMVDPYTTDFFREVIVERVSIKDRLASATGAEQTRLSRYEKFLKLLANSTSCRAVLYLARATVRD